STLRATRSASCSRTRRGAPRSAPPHELTCVPSTSATSTCCATRSCSTCWCTTERLPPVTAGAVLSPSVDASRDELDLEAVTILEVLDERATEDRMAIGTDRRPAVVAGPADDVLEALHRVDRERDVVEPGAHAAVEHAGHHVGRLLEGDGEPARVPEQQQAVERAVAHVAELAQQPAPRLLGSTEVGHPQRHVVEHRAIVLDGALLTPRAPP